MRALLTLLILLAVVALSAFAFPFWLAGTLARVIEASYLRGYHWASETADKVVAFLEDAP